MYSFNARTITGESRSSANRLAFSQVPASSSGKYNVLFTSGPSGTIVPRIIGAVECFYSNKIVLH